MKYNVLPLWDLAKGEFKNRFDWRPWSKYKDAVSFNMKALSPKEDLKEDEKVLADKPEDKTQAPQQTQAKSDITSLNICAAVRYAEIKALTSGTTSMQGIGTDTKCASDFGVKNVEIKKDYEVTSDVRATTDIIPQDYVIPIMTEVIQPKIISEQNKGNKQFSFAQAIGLLKNRDTLMSITDDVDKKLKRFFDMSMAAWEGYMKFLTEAVSKGTGRAAIVHLAEGSRDDAYNQYEYQLAKLMGLTRPGFVIIHGVGMDKDDFAHAKRNGVDIVWSPFSNLLLYGQTLDVVEAIKQGVNISIGSDWSPTGSKNLLDELKIARRYLDTHEKEGHLITNKHLVEMATINAAKTLRLDNKLGRLEKGYMADIMAIRLDEKTDPYTSLVQAEQEDVQLVMINGQPLYGDRNIMQKVVAVTKDTLELLPKQDQACSFAQTKALRLPFRSAFDVSVEKNFSGKIHLLSLTNIEQVLNTAFSGYAGKPWTPSEQKKLISGIDKVYKCQDQAYTERFNHFVEKEMDENRKNFQVNEIDNDKGKHDDLFRQKTEEIRKLAL